MTAILLCSVIVSLFCNGLKISTGEGMLLHFIKRGLDRVFMLTAIPDGVYYCNPTDIERHRQEMIALAKLRYSKIYYPILHCIKCMPSIYGTAIAFIFFPITLHLLYQIPLVIFCSVTLNMVFYNFYAD